MIIKIILLWKPLALNLTFAKLLVLLFLGYKSCAELLNDGFTKNGVYQIQSQAKVIDVYCDQSSRGWGK